MLGLVRRASRLVPVTSSTLTAINSRLISNMSVEGRILSFLHIKPSRVFTQFTRDQMLAE